MEIEVVSIKENDDGSAEVVLDMDDEAKTLLLNYAFNTLLKETLDVS